MIEQDYLMRRIMALFAAIRRSWERELKHDDPLDSAEQLELALGQAVDFDSGLLLSLVPESFASMVQVSGTDQRLVAFMPWLPACGPRATTMPVPPCGCSKRRRWPPSTGCPTRTGPSTMPPWRVCAGRWTKRAAGTPKLLHLRGQPQSDDNP